MQQRGWALGPKSHSQWGQKPWWPQTWALNVTTKTQTSGMDVGGLSPGEASGSVRTLWEGLRQPCSPGNWMTASLQQWILSPLLPQLLPRSLPAPSSVWKHGGDINWSPVIRLSWCGLRQCSLDIFPGADSGSARVDNGFQHIGRPSGWMHAWRSCPAHALAAAGCCPPGGAWAPGRLGAQQAGGQGWSQVSDLQVFPGLPLSSCPPMPAGSHRAETLFLATSAAAMSAHSRHTIGYLLNEAPAVPVQSIVWLTQGPPGLQSSLPSASWMPSLDTARLTCQKLQKAVQRTSPTSGRGSPLLPAALGRILRAHVDTSFFMLRVQPVCSSPQLCLQYSPGMQWLLPHPTLPLSLSSSLAQTLLASSLFHQRTFSCFGQSCSRI